MPFRLSIFKTVVLMLLTSKAGSDHIGDPEPEVTWTPPADVSMFKKYELGANYTGLLWAGRTEFNWLVDIRSEDADQEFWAVGNLITSYQVLTTCRALDILQQRSSSPKETDKSPSEYIWSKEVYRHGCDLRVYYCQDYLWANGRFDASAREDRDSTYTGWRSPKEVIRHILCHSSDYPLLYDAAIIVMNKGMPPIPPRLGYMPTGFDYEVDKIKEMVMLDRGRKINHMTPFCYVVSFGRNSVNNKEYYTLDYKVKYRVYITPWKDCLDQWKYICPPKSWDCKNPEKYQNTHTLMCLRPRAKVGTVCDHDKGAPVVCNGQVIGLVIRGAEFQYCNNLYKIPFVAENIYNYGNFLDNSVSYAVQPVSKKTTSATKTGRQIITASSATHRPVLQQESPFFILSLALPALGIH